MTKGLATCKQALTLGWGAQPAAARLGAALGPGSEGFTRAGHGPLHGARAAKPPSSPPRGRTEGLLRCWVQRTDCFWRKKKKVFLETSTPPLRDIPSPLRFPPPNPTPEKFRFETREENCYPAR